MIIIIFIFNLLDLFLHIHNRFFMEFIVSVNMGQRYTSIFRLIKL